MLNSHTARTWQVRCKSTPLLQVSGMFTWYQLPSPLTQPQPPTSSAPAAAAGTLQPKPEPGVSTAPVSPPSASGSPVTITVSSTNTGAAPQSWWWRREESGRGHPQPVSRNQISHNQRLSCGPWSPHTTVQIVDAVIIKQRRRISDTTTTKNTWILQLYSHFLHIYGSMCNLFVS